MKRLKIETDGTHYYPFVKIGKKWEPIENYYVKDGLIYSTGSNKCDTLGRAEFLIGLAKNWHKSRYRRRVIWSF